MSAEELSEGVPIVPHERKLWRDATQWKILHISPDEDCVTIQAGAYPSANGPEIPVIFRCSKSGLIYQEWLKECARREAGGTVPLEFEGVTLDIAAEPTFTRVPEAREAPLAPIVRLVDSQLEERQHRLSELRKKFHELNWGDEKDRLLSEIVALEKRVLGDPCS